MDSTHATFLAHELTMEYLRANPAYLQGDKENIPNIVNEITDINKRFYDSIIENDVLDKLY